MFQEIFITEITTSELLVCRGCLATDIRLHDMRQNRLTEAYSTLLSTATPITDDLPHYLCSFCAALLLKCDGFRAKCISAQIILKNAILPSLEQTLENIKRIDRPTYFRQSYIQTIDIDVSNQKSNDNADQLLETVKSELENDIHNINDHFTDISADDNTDSVNDDSFILKNALSSNTRSLRKRKVENTATKRAKIKDLSNFKTDDIKNDEIHTKPTNNEVFRNSSEINKANSDTDDEITIADLKLNTKAKLNERTKEKNNIKETKQKIHKANPAGNKKTENVSKMYNMDEVNLSKEEQLKEVADRKNSENYLEAVHKCEICYKGFRFKESFNSHMLLHDDRSGKFICDVCSCHFQSIHRLRKHRATHKKKFTCKHAGCTYVTKHLSQAKEHYKWHGGVKDTCKHCGKECSGQTSYYHHLKLYHPTSDDLVRCEICGASCSGLLGFKMHEKRTHKEMFSPECHCSRCDTQFYCSSALKAHQGAAGLCDPRAKFCVRCGRSFDTEQLLREHEAEERKPRTSFKCEVCNKNFEGYTSLKKHQLRHAMTLHQRLVCEICGKVLSNQHILKQHYLNKHSTENPFKCPECPKSFRSIINLKYHSLIHTGEKPHPCPHCPNTFRSITNLRRHQLVHTDARPHSCEICAKAFKTKADCKAHVQAVHMKIYRPRVRRKYKKNE